MQYVISHFFSQYAYSPGLVYGAVCGFMLLSAFGLPLPEELILVSAGLVGYMSINPHEFPPPYPGAHHVNIFVLAAVSFLAVLGSDYLIFHLGAKLGPKLFRVRWFARMLNEAKLQKIQNWMWEYGYWMVFLFRFTPGVRFPGHLTCGAMGLSKWRFMAVDSLAAGISVPTQVLLVAIYGETILKYVGRGKLVVVGSVSIALGFFLLTKWLARRSDADEATNTSGMTADIPIQQNAANVSVLHPSPTNEAEPPKVAKFRH
jgi:membrane protein DedA with SNARE-associated domain